MAPKVGSTWRRRFWEPIDCLDHYKIPLSRGEFALIDKDDYNIIKQYNWNCWFSPKTPGLKYAFSSVKAKHRMHRLITNCPPDKEVDHIDNNGLNNRKSNLRICDRTHNMFHVGPTKRNTSGYKGVSWSKKHRKWVTHIRVNKRSTYLGAFDDIVEASEAYNNKAKEFQGEFQYYG